MPVLYILIDGTSTTIESADLAEELDDNGFTVIVRSSVRLSRSAQFREAEDVNADFVLVIDDAPQIIVKALLNGEQRTYTDISELMAYLQGE